MSTFIDLVHKWLGHGQYNATLPTATDGLVVPAQCDSRGRLIVALGADTGVATETSTGTTWVHLHAPDDKALVTATANKGLCFFYFQSTYASAGFMQFHNLAATGSLVSTTSVPHIASIAIPANGLVSFAFPRARMFSTGIVWAFSSTANVYTEVAAATVCASVEIV